MITNYAELQAAVAAWLHRTDLAAIIPDFITLAETRLSADLEARQMEVLAPLVCVPTVRFVSLPDDMVEMRRLALVDADPVSVLEYKSPDQLTQDNPFIFATGKPVCFTILGSEVELSPVPDAAYALEMLYRQKIPALSAINTTNWLLTADPNAYLFASLVASAAYTQDEARIPMWEQNYAAAVAAINSEDWYSGTTMRVKCR